VFRPQATTVPGPPAAGEAAAGLALSTAVVEVARTGVVAAVAVGTVAAVAVGTLADVGVAPLPAQAATVASSPPMRATLVILTMASGCPIIWTPPLGTRGGAIQGRPRLA
jgi:hypothetical protein